MNQQTTVPFELIGCYKQIIWRKVLPIFQLIPTEQDFNISTSQVNFGASSLRICLDLELLIVIISKTKGEYFVTHEFSFSEQWASFPFGGTQDWEQVMTSIKEALNNEVLLLESHLAKVKRLVW